MEKFTTKIEWTEIKERPLHTGMYFVLGKMIKNGQLFRTIVMKTFYGPRTVSGGPWGRFEDCKDLVVEFWAPLPEFNELPPCK